MERRVFFNSFAYEVTAALEAAAKRRTGDGIKEGYSSGEFTTDRARWLPIGMNYFQRNEAINPSNIPPDTRALSIEGGPTNFGEPPPLCLLKIIQGDERDPQRSHLLIPPNTLQYMADYNILAALVDIAIPPSDENAWLSQIITGCSITIAGLLLKAIQLKARQSELAKPSNKSAKPVSAMSRRKFLHSSLASVLIGAGALVSIPPIAKPYVYGRLFNQTEKLPPSSITNYDPKVRALQQVMAVINALQPNNLGSFFREVLAAHKLMMVADRLSTNLSKEGQPRITYILHYKHLGLIEDLLRIGDPNLTRRIILAFPDNALRSIIRANDNDHRSLCAVRLVGAHKTLQVVWQERGKNSGWRCTWNPKEKVFDKTVTDFEMLGELKIRDLIPPPQPNLNDHQLASGETIFQS